MPDYRGIEQQFPRLSASSGALLPSSCKRRHPPGCLTSRERSPSGCSFWRLAASGRTFYTVPGDHYN